MTNFKNKGCVVYKSKSYILFLNVMQISKTLRILVVVISCRISCGLVTLLVFVSAML